MIPKWTSLENCIQIFPFFKVFRIWVNYLYMLIVYFKLCLCLETDFIEPLWNYTKSEIFVNVFYKCSVLYFLILSLKQKNLFSTENTNFWENIQLLTLLVLYAFMHAHLRYWCYILKLYVTTLVNLYRNFVGIF